MALVNRLRKIVDQPVWEWMRYIPFTTAATNTFILPPLTGSGNQYIYAINNTDFWRYDTYSDSWSYINAGVPVGVTSTCTGTWKVDDGYHTYAISGSSSTITGAFLAGETVKGLKIKVINGLGAGQERTITDVSDPTTFDYLTVTNFTNAGAGVGSITDSSKKWRINQWRNYQIRVYLGTSQQYFIRTILYNNNDTLFFADANWHAIDTHNAYNHGWDNGFLTPSTSYGSRAVIESSVITLDSPLITPLDITSECVIKCGTLHYITNTSAGSFFTHHWWEPLRGQWFSNHSQTGVIPSYLAGSELYIEGIDSSIVATYDSGSITSATTRSLTDNTKSWIPGQFNNYKIRNLTNGQEHTIIRNTNNTITIGRDWDVPMSASNLYDIVPDDDKYYMMGAANATLAQYSDESNSWSPSQVFDWGVANIAYVQYSSSGEMKFPISTITRTGAVATVTTIANHPFKDGDRIFISGALGADGAFYNGNFVVTSSYPLSATLTAGTGPTLFTYGMSGTPSANATLNSHTTTPIFDMSKNWQTNEHAGKVLQIWNNTAQSPTTYYRLIASNTSQSLTLNSALPATIAGAIWGYNIISSASFQASYGLDPAPYTGSTYFVSGSTVNGAPFVYVTASLSASVLAIPLGAPITGSGIPAGTFFRSFDIAPTAPQFISMSISQNATATANIWTTSSMAATWGHGQCTSGTTTILTDSTKNWPSNFWAGARLRINAGTNVGNEYTITANTNNTLTVALTTAFDSTSVYSIIPNALRTTGGELKWIYGYGPSGSADNRGKYIYLFEGNATTRYTKYNINTMQLEYPRASLLGVQLGEALGTGTMYAYDGESRLYIQTNANARIYYLDVDLDVTHNAGQIPAGMSTARQGRRMWMVRTEDNLKYLYVARHNDTPFWRQLTFF